MNLGQSIRSGVKWLVAGNIGNRILGFVFGVILARLLVPEDFGMVLTIQVFTGFAGMLTSGGMGQSIIRAKEASEEDYNTVFTLQLGLGVLLFVGFFFTSPWIADFFEDPLYADLMRVSALVFLMKPFGIMRGAWLNREMDFKTLSMVAVTVGLFTGLSSTLMAFAGMGVWSLTLSGVFAAAMRNVLLAWRTPLRLHLNFDRKIMRRHSGFGIKITASGFLTYFRSHGVNLLMSKLAGPGFLGLFNKADSLYRLPVQTLAGSVAKPLFRAMAEVQDDLDKTKYMYHRVVTLFAVYVGPFFVAFWWLAEPFIGGVYGQKWVPAAEPLTILASAGVFRIVGHPCGVVLTVQNQLNRLLVAQAVTLGVALAACFIGLKWGLTGVAWGFVAAGIFSNVYTYILTYRILPTRIADLVRALTPGLILNSIFFTVLALTDQVVGEMSETRPLLYLLAMAIPGGLAYAAAFLLLPIPALSSEAARWREKIRGGLRLFYAWS